MKLSICVFACTTVEKYRQQIIKIMETWGKDAPEVLFFVGDQPDYEPASCLKEYKNIIHLPGVGDDYNSAGMKQNLGLKYIYEKENPDFVFVCGTDTFLRIDALRRFLSFFDSTKEICIGGHQDTRVIGKEELEFFYGGAGFVLTNATLAKLYPFLQTMYMDWTNLCTDSNAEDLIPACDCCIAWYVKKLEIKRLAFKYRFYECNHRGKIDLTDYIMSHLDLYKKHGINLNEIDWFYDCCSDINQRNIISCHNMKPEDMDEFYFYCLETT
jgi:Fringe-like